MNPQNRPSRHFWLLGAMSSRLAAKGRDCRLGLPPNAGDETLTAGGKVCFELAGARIDKVTNDEQRPALLLGESMPAPGRKNVMWSGASVFCLLLSGGGLVNVLLKLSASQFFDAFVTFGFVYTNGFAAMFFAAQTTWGSLRVQRFICRPRAGGRPPTL